MGRDVIIDQCIERSLNGASVTITVPSSGEHLGRNGHARIKGLRLWYRWDGTVFLDSINSRGDITAGGLHNVPVNDLLLLLEHLKTEVKRKRSLADHPDKSRQ